MEIEERKKSSEDSNKENRRHASVYLRPEDQDPGAHYD